MWPCSVCLPHYLLYQNQIKLCQTHSAMLCPCTYELVVCALSRMYLFPLPDPFAKLLPSLQDLAWPPLTKEAFPDSHSSSKRAGLVILFLVSSLCLRLVCFLALATYTIVPDSCLCLCLFSAWLGAGTQWILGWMDSWMDLSLGKAYPEITSSYILLCDLQSLYERALSQRRRKYNFPQTVRGHSS